MVRNFAHRTRRILYVCTSGFSLLDEILIPNLKIEYILLFLKSAFRLKQMERYMAGGSYPTIVESELKKVRILFPPIHIQEKIIEENSLLKNRLENERNLFEEKVDKLNKKINEIFLG
ncbi:restriction endonuclease subunit S [Ornithinibacillus contaminans]|uniref:restriction endonuclease subunit S n=1 Tax=Ornithinibacillus contaminans TaxID=694055 RepID=UPI0012ED4235|nr:restriction endonuclease subunit S [Ornithinibacillus contaminans]